MSKVLIAAVLLSPLVFIFFILLLIMGESESRAKIDDSYACSAPARLTSFEFAGTPHETLDQDQVANIFSIAEAGAGFKGATAKDQAVLIMWAGRASGFGKFIPAGTTGMFALGASDAPELSIEDKADPGSVLAWAYTKLAGIESREDVSLSLTLEILAPGTMNVFTGGSLNTYAGMTSLETLILAADVLGVPALKDCGSLQDTISAPGVPDLSTDGLWSWPVAKPHITSNFGWRFHPVFHVNKLHAGTDFQAACGTPIYAVNGGVVKTATKMQGLGNTVFITHSPVLESRSAHMLDGSLLVKKGDFVKAGQQIGLAGTTGTSTGCHLHFETHVNGAASDPMPILTGAGLSGFTGGK